MIHINCILKRFFAIIVVISGLNFVYLHAQTLTYQYDASGNRVKRLVSTKSMAIDTTTYKPLSDSLETGEINKDFFVSEIDNNNETFNVKVYPNPSSGFFETEILGLKENEKAKMEIYTFSGRLLKRFDEIENRQPVDISDRPAGIYLLKITAGANSLTVKLIKQ